MPDVPIALGNESWGAHLPPVAQELIRSIEVLVLSVQGHAEEICNRDEFSQRSQRYLQRLRKILKDAGRESLPEKNFDAIGALLDFNYIKGANIDDVMATVVENVDTLIAPIVSEGAEKIITEVPCVKDRVVASFAISALLRSPQFQDFRQQRIWETLNASELFSLLNSAKLTSGPKEFPDSWMTMLGRILRFELAENKAGRPCYLEFPESGSREVLNGDDSIVGIEVVRVYLAHRIFFTSKGEYIRKERKPGERLTMRLTGVARTPRASKIPDEVPPMKWFDQLATRQREFIQLYYGWDGETGTFVPEKRLTIPQIADNTGIVQTGVYGTLNTAVSRLLSEEAPPRRGGKRKSGGSIEATQSGTNELDFDEVPPMKWFDQLATRQREFIQLYYGWDGETGTFVREKRLSVPQIAQKLGLKVGGVYATLRTAQGRLKAEEAPPKRGKKKSGHKVDITQTNAPEFRTSTGLQVEMDRFHEHLSSNIHLHKAGQFELFFHEVQDALDHSPLYRDVLEGIGMKNEGGLSAFEVIMGIWFPGKPLDDYETFLGKIGGKGLAALFPRVTSSDIPVISAPVPLSEFPRAPEIPASALLRPTTHQDASETDDINDIPGLTAWLEKPQQRQIAYALKMALHQRKGEKGTELPSLQARLFGSFSAGSIEMFILSLARYFDRDVSFEKFIETINLPNVSASQLKVEPTDIVLQNTLVVEGINVPEFENYISFTTWSRNQKKLVDILGEFCRDFLALQSTPKKPGSMDVIRTFNRDSAMWNFLTRGAELLGNRSDMGQVMLDICSINLAELSIPADSVIKSVVDSTTDTLVPDEIEKVDIDAHYIRQVDLIKSNTEWMNQMSSLCALHRGQKYAEFVTGFGAIQKQDVWSEIISLRDISNEIGARDEGEGYKQKKGIDILFELEGMPFSQEDKELYLFYLDWKVRIGEILHNQGITSHRLDAIVHEENTQLHDDCCAIVLQVPLRSIKKGWAAYEERNAHMTNLYDFICALVRSEHSGQKSYDGKVTSKEIRAKLRHIQFPETGE